MRSIASDFGGSEWALQVQNGDAADGSQKRSMSASCGTRVVAGSKRLRSEAELFDEDALRRTERFVEEV